MLINSLSSDKYLNLSKLKAFGDDKINVTEKLKFVSARVKNIVGKGEKKPLENTVGKGEIARNE